MEDEKSKEEKSKQKTIGNEKEKEKVHLFMKEVIVGAQLFGFKPISEKKLEGEGGDINILVTTEEQQKFVLKVSDVGCSLEFMKQQNQLAEYLEARHKGIEYPILMPALNGELIPVRTVNKKEYYFRLMKFIQGVHLDRLETYSKTFLRYVGRVLGEMSSILR